MEGAGGYEVDHEIEYGPFACSRFNAAQNLDHIAGGTSVHPPDETMSGKTDSEIAATLTHSHGLTHPQHYVFTGASTVASVRETFRVFNVTPTLFPK
jgi:hypothetical protein